MRDDAAVMLVMPLRRSLLLRGLAPAVALSLAMAVTPPARGAAPQGDFEQLIAEADGHASQGRHAEALRAYSDAFRSMPTELKASGVGEFVAVAAGKAAIDDFAARGDRRSLEDARMILLAFVGAAKAADPASGPAPIDAAKERLAEIDALMPEVADAPIEPLPAPADEEPAPPPPADDTKPDRSRLGVGLVVAGGVAAVAGLGLVIAGARQVPWYEQKLETEGWLPTDAGYDQQIADAERVRTIDLGIGAAALVVGVGLGVTGAVLLARSKQSKRGGVAVVPVLGRDRALLGATMRF
jgi:hypothetical protein